MVKPINPHMRQARNHHKVAPKTTYSHHSTNPVMNHHHHVCHSPVLTSGYQNLALDHPSLYQTPRHHDPTVVKNPNLKQLGALWMMLSPRMMFHWDSRKMSGSS